MKTQCPKCGSENARYVADEVDVTLRCLCGYNRVVQTRLKQIEIQHNDPVEDIRLPRRDTNLWWTLVVLVSLRTARSEAIASRLQDLGLVFSLRDVASYLTILRTKGLVYETEVKRRVAGGSTWAVSDRCVSLLGGASCP